ncbi:BTB/POZ domain-containing protein 9-like protein, partial [Leptotrombidium deliense]
MDHLNDKIMKNLREDESLKNVTFIFDDCEIKANRCLLGASCPYFESMLFGNTNEANQTRIVLKSTSRIAFEKVVEFIHRREDIVSSLGSNDILELVKLAHEYQFDELLAFLEYAIVFDDYSVSFCVELFDTLEIIGSVDWKEECLLFLDSIFKIEANKRLFSSFSRTLVDQLTCRDSFLIKEVDLFYCLLEWKHESHDGLFSNLRLNLITINEFNQIVKPTNVIKADDYLEALIKNTFAKRDL